MLSVVLAVHNEAKNLPTCLESIKDIADEIVVVDGESTDQTVQIAKKYGARVIPTTNKLNFHINKQMAIESAKHTLVLQLDADEVVDQTLARFIKNMDGKISKTASLAELQPKGWQIARKNWYMGRFLTKGGQYPDPVIRLYIHGYAKLPQKNVHEQIEIDGEVGWADGHLLHYSHPNFADTIRKMNTYTSFEAQRLRSSGQQLTPLFILEYCLIKPIATFCSLFLRHRGYVDGVSGFTFALVSALHHPITCVKLWETYATNQR